MRIPAKSSKQLPLKRIIIISTSFLILILIWIRINASSSETTVSPEELIIATVEKGDLTREVRAPGTLVPIELNYLSAASNGRVEEILLEAGASVEVGTVIIILDNPELSQAVDTARFEIETLQAALTVQEQRLRQEVLQQRIKVADFKTRHQMAQLRKQANQRLLKAGIAAKIDYEESILLAEQLEVQHQLEIERLQSLPALRQAELTAAKAKIQKAMRQLSLQQKLLDSLEVKSATKGILQEVHIDEGEQVLLGTTLARIARQDKLKAQLRVQESQVKYVTKGQPVIVSADGKTAQGMVRRIDPAVQQGAVLVDVYFTETNLAGARPDLRIDGTIQLEHLKNVLKLKRPVFSQEFSSSSLFVLNKEQTRAERKQVKFGRGSIDVIEVLSLLKEGDRVVVSNMNKYSDLNNLRLH